MKSRILMKCRRAGPLNINTLDFSLKIVNWNLEIDVSVISY